jgi:hypothetical protein
MRRLSYLTALFGALLLASLASTASAAPPTDHFRDTINETYPDTQCGVDGTSTFNGIDNIQVWDDKFKVETHDTQLFTSAATGKSVLLFYSFNDVQEGPIDNGDGTVTLTTSFKGLMEKLKLPNGPILSRDAGLVTFNGIYDPTTGDLLSETISRENGPHPELDSGGDFGGGALYCDVIVPALS